MAAMFDLTELTGTHADHARTAVIGIWQVPAPWTWPAAWGMVIGLLVTLPLVPILGPSIMAATFLGAPIAIALTVGKDEAPWKRAANRVRSYDATFMFCGRPLEMSPSIFYRSVPSAVAVDEPEAGERP
jgi:hypothetical protein